MEVELALLKPASGDADYPLDMGFGWLSTAARPDGRGFGLATEGGALLGMDWLELLNVHGRFSLDVHLGAGASARLGPLVVAAVAGLGFDEEGTVTDATGYAYPALIGILPLGKTLRLRGSFTHAFRFDGSKEDRIELMARVAVTNDGMGVCAGLRVTKYQHDDASGGWFGLVLHLDLPD
jgi:hypothetical protein